MRRALLLVTAFVAVFALALPANGAVISDRATLLDPAGDVSNPKGDASRARLVHGVDEIKVSMRLHAWGDPMTDRHWTEGFTQAQWFLDVGGDNHPDYIAAAMKDSEGMRAMVFDRAPGTTVPECEGTAQVNPETHTITFGFDHACISRPERVRFFARMMWDRDPDNPGTNFQRDRVYGPNAGGIYSPWATVPSG